MTGLMNDEELNIYCEYVLMPRLNVLVDMAHEAGADAYLTVDRKQLPAVALDSEEGRFILSYTPLDIDWEDLMELKRDSCVMLFSATLRLASDELEEQTGRLIFPEEQMPGFEILLALLKSGMWMRENALDSVYAGADVLPKLNGLLPLLDDNGFEHTGVLYPEGVSPMILVESAGSAYEFSYIHFDEDTYLLRIAYRDNPDYADAMLFPEGSAMEEAEYYDKVLGIFERFSIQ